MSHLLTHPDKIKGRGGVGAFLRILPSERPYFYDNDIFGGEDIRRGACYSKTGMFNYKKRGGTPPSNGFSDTKKREGKVFCKSVITDSGVFIGGCLTVF